MKARLNLIVAMLLGFAAVFASINDSLFWVTMDLLLLVANVGLVIHANRSEYQYK